MPTVTLNRDELFSRLGRTFTKREFEDLCFEFGIELDEETTEKEQVERMMGSDAAREAKEEWVYKIEVPANRYDLLCMEGMSQALNVFLGNTPHPNFHYSAPKTAPQQLIVKPETAQIRPFVVGAVLRNLTLNQRAYESFLELQAKLHQNICRERKLVAIGTHDLDTVEGPFTYEALAPEKIKFAPLRHPDKVMDANQLFNFIDEFEGYKDLRPYLPIIRNSPVYPVILDAKRRVLSLPPIINGEHSKISVATKNVLIECTATDLTKARIVLDTLVAAFSEYSQDKYSVERVEVVFPDERAGSKSIQTPDISTVPMKADVTGINKGIGNLPAPLDANKIQQLLTRMMLKTDILNEQTVQVQIPITRSDILHPCDIVEDVAIAYGFNNVPTRIPQVHTTAKQYPINKLSDMVRREMAQAAYMEILTMALLSREENFTALGKPDDGKAVIIANPATEDFQVCRTSLIPGMLKTLTANTDTKKPLKLFECSDVVLLDSSTDTGARNERRLVAVYQDTNTAGFQFIHGLLDRLMVVLNVAPSEYSLKPSQDETFFPGCQARVIVRGQDVGIIGVVHPRVLINFIKNQSLTCPASALEINLERFL
eukprot:c3538_g1_i1.p1 GENE.c3538_g1_i1~~c3538_g1_i1.p1  ORF type:complete len:615 (+),score=146.24 c3538_g1_i1:46-1845(+)